MSPRNVGRRKFIYKTLLLGESAVGKTSLVKRYVKNVFQSNLKSTIGMSVEEKKLNFLDKNLQMQIWDFGGQQQFQFVRDDFYKGTKGALTVFDLQKPNTLQLLKDDWYHEYDKLVDTNEAKQLKVLVGNKADKENRRITYEAGSNIAKRIESDYLETSAKTGANVDEAFKVIAAKMLLKHSNEITSAEVNHFIKETVNENAQIFLVPAPDYAKLTHHELSAQIKYAEPAHYQDLIDARQDVSQEKLAREVGRVDKKEFEELKEKVITKQNYSKLIQSLPEYKEAEYPGQNLKFCYL